MSQYTESEEVMQCKKKQIVDNLKKLVGELHSGKYTLLEEEDEIIQQDSQPKQEEAKEDAMKVEAQSVKVPEAEPDSTATDQGVQWIPPYLNIEPENHPLMPCYTRSKDGITGMRIFCECESSAGSHSHIPPSSQPRPPIPADIVEDYCTQRTSMLCPNDPDHNHWVPTVNPKCNYPNYCKASCFDHPSTLNWYSNVSNYTFYLEKRLKRRDTD